MLFRSNGGRGLRQRGTVFLRGIDQRIKRGIFKARPPVREFARTALMSSGDGLGETRLPGPGGLEARRFIVRPDPAHTGAKQGNTRQSKLREKTRVHDCS